MGAARRSLSAHPHATSKLGSRRSIPTMATTSRELLSRHVTRATFAGIEPGREPMLRIYPPQPAKMWANFQIDEYFEHEKPGQYGDERTDRFAFVAEEQSEAIAATLSTLQPGDAVRLAWNHDYVTRTDEGGGVAKFPERPVQQLERI